MTPLFNEGNSLIVVELGDDGVIVVRCHGDDDDDDEDMMIVSVMIVSA